MLRLCELLEDIALILEGDADSGVGDGEDDRLPRSIQGCGDAHMPLLCELEGIRDEVAQDLGNLPLVSVEGRDAVGFRSEERRVGKECRSRWWPSHSKKDIRPAPGQPRFETGHLIRIEPFEGIIRDALLVFFFSSRRRHTRSLCDWSSDVCSSD